MMDFDFDIAKEVKNIRGDSKKDKSPADKKGDLPADGHDRHVEQKKHQHGGGSSKAGGSAEGSSASANRVEPIPNVTAPNEIAPEVDGLEVKVTQEERFGGGGPSQKGVAPVDEMDWSAVKPLGGIFETVGGDRPIKLIDEISQVQTSGIHEPFFDRVQERLKKLHMGAIVEFPWGDYQITDKNKVFTTRSSLVRYLLFEGLRDTDGAHVQYAKQWLYFHVRGVFTTDFNPARERATSDALDIYALLYTAHAYEQGQTEEIETRLTNNQDPSQDEHLFYIQTNMRQILEKLVQQEDRHLRALERQNTIQTLLLLDRMGLLKGGLPRDVDALAGVLEESRDAISGTGVLIDYHIKAEKERERRLNRERDLAKRRF